MNTEHQEHLPKKKFLLKKQISEKLFNSHSPSHQYEFKGGSPQNQRKIIFPPIQVSQEHSDQKNQNSPKFNMAVEKMDYIKLPEIDEKFFFKRSIQQDLFNAKGQYQNKKTTTEEYEAIENEQIISAHHAINKKVDFQEDVIIYDYVNQTCKKSNIDGSQKPLKFIRQKKNFSDDFRNYNDTFRHNGKSQFFETRERNNQKHYIIDTLQMENHNQLNIE
ncbi:unnamed protein product [Paramecium sonneborni]|uniref:Uncharacterized protein n=1 Tax=Paramecium sonneborni TaxID=65129 RepID=A0A8S1R0X0_9CILI|nr:unnamed protein product [Paramecium sonneborni]